MLAEVLVVVESSLSKPCEEDGLSDNEEVEIFVVVLVDTLTIELLRPSSNSILSLFLIAFADDVEAEGEIGTNFDGYLEVD